MVNLKLTYFDLAGRAEHIRLALTIAGIPFEDERVPRDQWPQIKPKTPFGKVPILTIDNKTVLAESQAILRYVARLKPESGLYPEDLLEAAKVDMFLNAQDDIGALLRPSFFEQDAEKKVQMRRDLISESGPLTTAIKLYDEQLVKQGTPGYSVGNKLTIADLGIYSFLAWLKMGVLDGIPKDFVDQFKNVVKVYENVAGHPKVQEWYKAHGK